MTMTSPEYDCSKCKKRYFRQPDMQRRHQERKGCFNEYPSPILRYRGEPETPMSQTFKINYFKCPAQLYSPYWASIINMHNKYLEGLMPFEGGPLDQPAIIVDAFNLIHNLKEETRITQEKAQKKYGERSKR